MPTRRAARRTRSSSGTDSSRVRSGTTIGCGLATALDVASQSYLCSLPKAILGGTRQTKKLSNNTKNPDPETLNNELLERDATGNITLFFQAEDGIRAYKVTGVSD